MSSRISDLTQRQAAVVSGLAYVVISVLGVYSNFAVFERLTVSDDAAATFANIVDDEVLYCTGVAAFVVVFIADIVVAWGLYAFFKRTSPDLSLLAAWLRLVYAGIAGAVTLHLLVVGQLIDDSGYATAIESGDRQVQVMLALDSYTYGWSIGLVVFGAHLLVLGYVMVRSVDAPRVLGILVILAGAGYVVSHLALVLLPGYEDYADAFTVLTVVLAIPGEFGLIGWLLWRAGKDGQTRDRREETADVESLT